MGTTLYQNADQETTVEAFMKNKLILSIALFAIGILVAGSAPAGKVAASGTWSLTDPMAAARQYHTATTLQNGTVLVAGGCSDIMLDSGEIFDPATGHWTSTNPMSAAHCQHTANLLHNGKVLVAG